MLLFKSRTVVNVEIDGVDYRDYPDFCNAYFSYAEWDNGTLLNDDELEQLTQEPNDVVNEMACERMIDAAEHAHDCAMNR